MPLKQLLRLLLVVVNDAGVCSTVENLGPRVRRQVVDALVDIFVEAKDPLEIQSRNSVALLLLGHFLAIVVLHHLSFEE